MLAAAVMFSLNICDMKCQQVGVGSKGCGRGEGYRSQVAVGSGCLHVGGDGSEVRLA